MMGTLSIASWGYLFGAAGQMSFFWRLFPGLPRWVFAVLVCVPWLTIFLISFCNAPPCGPRRFRLCLLFAIWWYVGMCLLSEVLCAIFQPPVLAKEISPAIARGVMYLFGAISTAVFVRACLKIRRYESDAGR